jgi:hypothetical protein
MENKKIIKIIFTVVLCLSLIGNVAMAYLHIVTVNNLNKIIEVQNTKNKILSFTEIFVQKILMASQDIDFDTRLELETEVRSLNDSEILDQWQKFTKSTTKSEASAEAKTLLNLLVVKSADLK